MARFLIVVVLLNGFFWFNIDQVSSITCYHCFSTVSWDDCNRNVLEKNCSTYVPHNLNACLVQYVEIPPTTVNDTQKTRYVRRCADKKRCKTLEDECNGMCRARCCDTDRCNSAGLKRISLFTLVTGIMYCLVLY